jgi:hypothetical protein
MKNERWFYWLILPLTWAGGSLLHFRFPGDEYALWAVSSLAGSWVFIFIPNVGDINQPAIRLLVAGAGAVIIAGVGGILSWLRVRWWVWTTLWLATSLAWLGFTVGQYPSLERALAKNGSWWAYIFSAMLMGCYSALLLGAVGGGFKRCRQKLQGKRAQTPA